jgi:hypothetical protein
VSSPAELCLRKIKVLPAVRRGRAFWLASTAAGTTVCIVVWKITA